MKVVTRFAPSPTGSLHIGGARTALFNWLYARHTGGEFLLRIEDTDAERNDPSVIKPIFEALDWLGLDVDREPVYQSANQQRHYDVARALMSSGAAYACYMTPEEIEFQKAANRKNGRALRSPWRNVTDGPWPDGPYVIRIRQPDTGTVVVDDLVQGSVKSRNDGLDDFVILRTDGTPTYMLASVVDDYDAGVTHVIRGDDHLTNTFRQQAILEGMGWDKPTYAHIPLIHSPDGKKLSKRDGAAGVEFYRDAGYLSDATLNYLLKMGWGHGDQEIFTRAEAIELFDLSGVGRGPSRLNPKKLDSLNSQMIRMMSPRDFAIAVEAPFALTAIIPFIQERAKTLVHAREMIRMIVERPPAPLPSPLLFWVERTLPPEDNWNTESIKASVESYAERTGVPLGEVAKKLRMAVFGAPQTPPLFEVMEVLGREEIRARFVGEYHDAG
jgi:glutamyl-tRNA synthetase